MTNPDPSHPVDPRDFERQPFADLLESIAAKVPTPGGGAALSAAGALAAALGGMVVAYSLGKKALASHQPALEDAAAQLTRARTLLLDLGRADMEAYGEVNALQRLPENDPARVERWDAAVVASIQTPRAALALSLDLLRLFERLVPITNRYLHSDLAIAAVLAEACARAAAWNVRINAPLLANPAERETLSRELASLLADAASRCAAVERACEGA